MGFFLPSKDPTMAFWEWYHEHVTSRPTGALLVLMPLHWLSWVDKNSCYCRMKRRWGPSTWTLSLQQAGTWIYLALACRKLTVLVDPDDTHEQFNTLWSSLVSNRTRWKHINELLIWVSRVHMELVCGRVCRQALSHKSKYSREERERDYFSCNVLEWLKSWDPGLGAWI